MGNRCLLIRLPALPYRLDTLCPDYEAACLAGDFDREQHNATILDFGTLETFERLITFHRSGRVAKADTRAPWDGTGEVISNAVRVGCETSLCAHVVNQIDNLAPETVLVHVEKKEDLSFAILLAARIRENSARLAIVGFGAYFRDRRGSARVPRGFDGVFVGLPGADGAALARWIGRRERWSSIRGLVTRQNRQAGTISTSGVLDASPAYDRETYPALASNMKFRLFELTEPSHRLACSQTADFVQRLADAYGPCGFHMGKRDRAEPTVDRFAAELLSRKQRASYGREIAVEQLQANALPILRASGCRVLTFDLNTGSQRLLDDHYGRTFTVTQAETALRASKFTNLYTIARFSNPCDVDDFHTLAETLRLVTRTKPDAVELTSTGELDQNHRAGIRSKWNVFGRRTNSRRLLQERNSLVDAVEDLGVTTKVPPRTALLAELCGYAGREQEFTDRVHYQLSTGDAAGIATHMERMNQGAAYSPTDAAALEPFVRIQNAVGN